QAAPSRLESTRSEGEESRLMKMPLMHSIQVAIALLLGASVTFAQEPSPSSKDNSNALAPASALQLAPDTKISTAPAADKISSPATETKAQGAAPSEAEMKQMMELSKTGENHKLLA